MLSSLQNYKRMPSVDVTGEGAVVDAKQSKSFVINMAKKTKGREDVGTSISTFFVDQMYLFH